MSESAHFRDMLSKLRRMQLAHLKLQNRIATLQLELHRHVSDVMKRANIGRGDADSPPERAEPARREPARRSAPSVCEMMRSACVSFGDEAFSTAAVRERAIAMFPDGAPSLKRWSHQAMSVLRSRGVVVPNGRPRSYELSPKVLAGLVDEEKKHGKL